MTRLCALAIAAGMVAIPVAFGWLAINKQEVAILITQIAICILLPVLVWVASTAILESWEKK